MTPHVSDTDFRATCRFCIGRAGFIYSPFLILIGAAIVLF
jgi:hypothetical protein